MCVKNVRRAPTRAAAPTACSTLKCVEWRRCLSASRTRTSRIAKQGPRDIGNLVAIGQIREGAHAIPQDRQRAMLERHRDDRVAGKRERGRPAGTASAAAVPTPRESSGRRRRRTCDGPPRAWTSRRSTGSRPPDGSCRCARRPARGRGRRGCGSTELGPRGARRTPAPARGDPARRRPAPWRRHRTGRRSKGATGGPWRPRSGTFRSRSRSPGHRSTSRSREMSHAQGHDFSLCLAST